MEPAPCPASAGGGCAGWRDARRTLALLETRLAGLGLTPGASTRKLAAALLGTAPWIAAARRRRYAAWFRPYEHGRNRRSRPPRRPGTHAARPAPPGHPGKRGVLPGAAWLLWAVFAAAVIAEVTAAVTGSGT